MARRRGRKSTNGLGGLILLIIGAVYAAIEAVINVISNNLGVFTLIGIVIVSVIVRRHIVGGANRILISVLLPPRLCRTGTCRRLSAE